MNSHVLTNDVIYGSIKPRNAILQKELHITKQIIFILDFTITQNSKITFQKYSKFLGFSWFCRKYSGGFTEKSIVR